MAATGNTSPIVIVADYDLYQDVDAEKWFDELFSKACTEDKIRRASFDGAMDLCSNPIAQMVSFRVLADLPDRSPMASKIAAIKLLNEIFGDTNVRIVSVFRHPSAA